MAYVWQHWLAKELRAAGLTVKEVEGWKTRGRPASTGQFDPRHFFALHHTGSTTSSKNPAAALSVLIYGRSDLPGPLCQVAIDYNGVVYVIAAGRANVNGKIGKRVAGLPFGGDGNALGMGVEVMTDGSQKMPPAQQKSVRIVAAVVANHYGKDERFILRHEDISGTGKWDLGRWSTAHARRMTKKALTALRKSKRKKTPLLTKAINAKTFKARRKTMRRIVKRGAQPVYKKAARQWLKGARMQDRAMKVIRKHEEK